MNKELFISRTRELIAKGYEFTALSREIHEEFLSSYGELEKLYEGGDSELMQLNEDFSRMIEAIIDPNYD